MGQRGLRCIGTGPGTTVEVKQKGTTVERVIDLQRHL